MSFRLVIKFLVLSEILLFSASCIPSGSEHERNLPNLPLLMSVSELDSLMNEGYFTRSEEGDGSLVLIEVGPAASYREDGHIPGALQVWRPDYATEHSVPYGGLRASRSHMELLLGSLGIHPKDHIILYDNKGSADALRLRWILKLYGHLAVSILDGGKKAWQMAGFPLSTDLETEKNAVEYRFPNPEDRTELAHLDDMLMALSDSNSQILDAREPEEFHGHPFLQGHAVVPWKNGAFDYGRIPNAIHLNWSDAVNLHGDHRFKPLDVIRYNVEQAGLSPEKQIIAYCQSGVRSAHMTFVLKDLLGYPDVKNYDGSWIEWSFFHAHIPEIPADKDLDRSNHREMSLRMEEDLKQKLQGVE
jgi:thiosulfate/3-mercaptopyruvate sulfurtransferase